MTQWRGPDWPTVTHSDFVFTAAEKAEMFHQAIIRVEPEIYEAMQQQATALMAELVEQGGGQ